jgi:predicted esterase
MRLRGFFLFSFVLTFFISHAQQLFEDQINVNSKGGVDKRDAIIYLPAHYVKNKAYPLVIFAHGMGEAGKNVKKLYKQGLPKVLKQGYRPPFDFIMVAVQRNSFSVAPEWLAGILKDCQKRWKIDASRIYLTGLSAGGWPVYSSQLNFSPAFAKKFAAIVINSGVITNSNKKHLDWWKETRTPLWAIVGGSDKGYVGNNAYMVNQINKRVPNLAHLTVRPGVGHGGWSEVYKGKVKLDGKNMWEWLYQFKRKSNGSSASEGKNTDDDKDDNDDKTPPPSPTPKPTTTYRNIKVNIGNGTNAFTTENWNHWNVGTSTSRNVRASNFKYEDGASSQVDATLSYSKGVVDNGPQYGGSMAPAGVLRFGSYSNGKRTLTITGLTPNQSYNIIVFSSRSKHPGFKSIYTLGKLVQEIPVNNNLTHKAAFYNIRPTGNGIIVITINDNHQYNYINGFVISEKRSK